MEDKDSIGHLLRKTREKQNLSLEEVANKTKININMLRSLEANRLEDLPNKTFVKGFVQNYSKCIGLDLKASADALNNTYKSKEPEPIETPVSRDQKPARAAAPGLSMEQLEVREKIVTFIRSAFDKRIIIGILALVLFVGTIKVIVSFFSQISKEKVNVAKITGEAPENIKDKDANLFELEASKKLRKKIQKEAKETEQAQLKPAPKKETTIVEAAKEEVKKVEEVKEVKAQAPTPAGKYPYKKFSTIRGKMYQLDGDAPEVSNQELLPNNIKDAALPGQSNVFINATSGDTWISYKVDGEEIKRYVLKQGRTLLIKGDIVLLFLGNINVTTIFYNNQLVKVNSRTGVKSLIFPQEISKNYELPLFPAYQGRLMTAVEYKANMAPKPEGSDEKEEDQD